MAWAEQWGDGVPPAELSTTAPPTSGPKAPTVSSVFWMTMGTRLQACPQAAQLTKMNRDGAIIASGGLAASPEGGQGEGRARVLSSILLEKQGLGEAQRHQEQREALLPGAR